MDLPHLILGRITLKRSSSVFAAPVRIPHNCEFPFAIAHFAKGSGLWAWRDLQLHAKISIILHPRSCHRCTAKVLKKLLKKPKKKPTSQYIQIFQALLWGMDKPRAIFHKTYLHFSSMFLLFMSFSMALHCQGFFNFFFFFRNRNFPCCDITACPQEHPHPHKIWPQVLFFFKFIFLVEPFLQTQRFTGWERFVLIPD